MTQNNFFDSMLYHKIARDKSFCNELYPCAPIVRLVIFPFLLTKSYQMILRVQRTIAKFTITVRNPLSPAGEYWKQGLSGYQYMKEEE